MNTQLISSLKAPAVINGLRNQVRDLKKEVSLNKKNEKKALKKLEKENKRQLLRRMQIAASMHEWHKFVENTDIDKVEGLVVGDITRIHNFHKERGIEKESLIKKLFDFRKTQDLEILKTESEKIINS